MKKIAVGEQELSKIITKNLVYVDKTRQILDAIDKQFIFLSRPRRWGKTITINTMKEIFLGNKELFKGLYAYDNYKEWDKSYPVIYISMADLDYKNNQLFSETLKKRTTIFIDKKEVLGTDYITGEYDNLADLIEKVNKETGKEVVILIDEYDTPFTRSLDDKEKFENVRLFFKNFYSGVKPMGPKIRFFYLSGLTKVAQASLFSTLNNLKDISYARSNYSIVGYTLTEIKTFYQEHIKESVKVLGTTEDELLRKLKDYYDGYNFGNLDDKLYNPWSINNFFEENSFQYYWVETGGESLTNTIIKSFPTAFSNIFKSLEDNKPIQLETLTRNLDSLSSRSLPLLLLNAGYLTFIDNNWNLGVANGETRYSLYKQYVDFLEDEGILQGEYNDICKKLTDAIVNGDEKGIKDNLSALNKLKNTPHDWLDKNPEGVMKEWLYFILILKGKNPKGEMQNNNGKTDIYFENNGYHYVIEYKIDGSLEEGMKQINDKYFNSYIHKKGYKIVINYKKKTTKDFEVLVEKF